MNDVSGGMIDYFDPMSEVDRLRRFLEDRVKGQPAAINSIAKIYEYELTLRHLEEKPGPVGVIMLLGPSGVGKTELARRLAEYFTGSIDGMKKINCASYSQPHMIHSLIGSPHGYVGYNDTPVLSQKSIDGIFSQRESELEDDREDIVITEKQKLIKRRSSINEQRISLDAKLQHRIQFSIFLKEFNDGVVGFTKNLIYLKERNIISEDEFESEILQITETAKKITQVISNLNMEIQQHVDLAAIMDKEIASIDRKLEIDNQISKKFKEGGGLDDLSLTGNRYFVLLFDEIEKANETLHRLLLEITEEGKVTLANGSVTDLRDAFIIMTSNVGARDMGDVLKGRHMGFSGGQIDKHKVYDINESDVLNFEREILKIAEREMSRTFPPEFRRRIDEVVVCRPLSKRTFMDILDFQLRDFSEKLRFSKIILLMTRGAKDFVINSSMHRREVGASLLSHKFKSLVKRPLGQYLASNPNFIGKIKVDIDDNKKSLKFNFKPDIPA